MIKIVISTTNYITLQVRDDQLSIDKYIYPAEWKEFKKSFFDVLETIEDRSKENRGL
jgi:hypothetical protein